MDRVGKDLAGWRLAALCLCLLALSDPDPDRRKRLMEQAEAVAVVRTWTQRGWLVAAERDPRSPGAKNREISGNANMPRERAQKYDAGKKPVALAIARYQDGRPLGRVRSERAQVWTTQPAHPQPAYAGRLTAS